MSAPDCTPRPQHATRGPMAGLSRSVVILGLASLLADVSSEMVYPLIPLFLTAVLGAAVTAVGLIEGIAESAASLLKVVAGWYSDHVQRRRPLVQWGYGLSAVAKPLLALAGAWPVVLVARLIDRTGKGVRTPPRDALLAASADPQHRGKAFGLHRAMDTTGALIGPLVALLLLSCLHASHRAVFLLAFVPAVGAVGVLSLLPRERRAPAQASRPPLKQALASGPLRRLLAVMGLFGLGNSSDAFLLLRARSAGLGEGSVLGVYVLYNLVYALAAAPAGWLSDRLSRRALLGAGQVLFALVYVGFAVAKHAWHVVPLFALYGCYAAATEGVARAYVADLASPSSRATAMGLLHTVTGVTVFAASSLAGVLWARWGAPAPFLWGAGCAMAAVLLLLAWCPGPPGSSSVAPHT